LALAGRRWHAGPGLSANGAPLWRTGLRTFVIVGLSAVVPLVLLSLLFGYRASTQQRQSAEFQVAMQIDGAAHRLDSILSGQAAAVLGVAGFRSVGLGDYPHLYEHLQLMPARHPEWENIILADEQGDRLMDLRAPFGRPLPSLDLSGLPADVGTNAVFIGDIAPAGKFAKERSVPIYVPVHGKDGRHLVVVVALDPALIGGVLEEAGLPADWRGAVVDNQGQVVGRTANSPYNLGDKAAPAHAGGDDSAYSLSSPIRQAQWTMRCEIPMAILDKPVNEAWWLMLVAGGGALGLAVLLALLVAGDVAERRQLELDKAERRLQASEAWRLLAVDAAAIGTWHWDAETGKLQGCERCRQLMGLRQSSLALRPLLSMFFPGEGKAVIGAALASTRAAKPFEREFRLRAEGGKRWLQVCGRPLFDERGEPIGTYGVLIDIDEQKRAEADHRALLGRLHSAQEEERLRIARDLHDRVGQSIAGLSLLLKRLEASGDSRERAQAFDELKAMILEISRDVHRAAVELRPTALDDVGLLGAIQTFLREWQRRTGLAVETFFTGFDQSRLPPLVETTAYRIIVELFTNIARHAGASSVSVTLSRRAELLTLMVEDDGCGMDRAAAEDSPPHRHLGLLGIRERLEIIGGEMHFETAPGAGTAVLVRIKLPAALMEGEAA
jgi:two-component system sensor histidine kinase UhpB